jgi:hypothetical protein
VLPLIILLRAMLGSVSYATGGHRRFPKETLDVTGGGANGRLDNFTRVSTWTPSGRGSKRSLSGQDKGQRAEVGAFVNGYVPSDAVRECVRVHDLTAVHWRNEVFVYDLAVTSSPTTYSGLRARRSEQLAWNRVAPRRRPGRAVQARTAAASRRARAIAGLRGANP